MWRRAAASEGLVAPPGGGQCPAQRVRPWPEGVSSSPRSVRSWPGSDGSERRSPTPQRPRRPTGGRDVQADAGSAVGCRLAPVRTAPCSWDKGHCYGGPDSVHLGQADVAAGAISDRPFRERLVSPGSAAAGSARADKRVAAAGALGKRAHATPFGSRNSEVPVRTGVAAGGAGDIGRSFGGRRREACSAGNGPKAARSSEGLVGLAR